MSNHVMNIFHIIYFKKSKALRTELIKRYNPKQKGFRKSSVLRMVFLK